MAAVCATLTRSLLMQISLHNNQTLLLAKSSDEQQVPEVKERMLPCAFSKESQAESWDGCCSG